jgi:hypothetical protein
MDTTSQTFCVLLLDWFFILDGFAKLRRVLRAYHWDRGGLKRKGREVVFVLIYPCKYLKSAISIRFLDSFTNLLINVCIFKL